MLRLTDNSSFPVLWRAAGRFLTWWRDELAQCCAPLSSSVAGRMLSRGSRRGARVSLSKTAGGTDAAPFHAALEAPSWSLLHTRLKAAGKEREPVTVELDEDLYLSRVASYPAGALANLDTIVDLDVEKSTPFDPDTALWKWRVLDRSGGHLRVETVILRRNHILTILNLASEAGIEISEITAAGAPPLRLLKLTTAADRRRTFWRRVNLGLAAVIVLLALGAAGTAYQKRSAAAVELEAQVTQAKTRALRLRKAQAEAEAQFETNALLQREKARSPSLAGVWNALSETLPSGVWLTEMQISGRNGRISGFADSAAPLIEKLETLDQLSGVSFVSPVTMNPDDRSERFDISFTLEVSDG